MSKKFLFNLILTLTAVAVAVLWLLSIVFEDKFGGFNFVWAVAIFSGVVGLLFILSGIISKTAVPIKKLCILFGAGLLIITLLSIVKIISANESYILPIIAIICTAALLLCVLATGGKSWDTGDNQKVGYKNYYQRKADEEKKNKK